MDLFMSLTLGETLQKGIDAHKAGQFEKAQRLYATILNAQPKHPDANHNMGVLAVGVGKIKAAIPFFITATIANPKVPQFWLSYINALINLGHLDEAQSVLYEAEGKGGESAKGPAFDKLQQQLTSQGFLYTESFKGNILDKVTLTKALRLAEKSAKDGRVEESKSIYQDILNKFPKHKDALKAFQKLVPHAPKLAPEPSSEKLQAIINLYIQGHLQKALAECKKMLEVYPNSVVLYNISGAANMGLKKFNVAINNYQQALIINPSYADAHYNIGIALDNKADPSAAIDSYKKAIAINPNYADAYNNMGVAMNNKGDFNGAINSYQKVLTIEPNNAQAYNNMGNAFKDKGELVTAIEMYSHAVKTKPDYAEAYNNRGSAFIDRSDAEAAVKDYKKALDINPNFAEAYNNLGVALSNSQSSEKAVDSYSKALKIRPNYTDAKLNLVTLLATYQPEKEYQNVIVTASKSIRKIDIKCNTQGLISDEQVIKVFSASSNIIRINNLELKTPVPQAFRRNSVELNCKRHMLIFKTHDVIPEFCFGCYKVQVEPRSVIDLIKLFFVFDQLKLENNNTRKCMIELRPEIPGFYKGLIYCSSLQQANDIAVQLDAVVIQKIGPGLAAKVKRGCSEYPVSFPDYTQINNAGPQLMNYNEDWRVIETQYDKKNLIQAEHRPPTLAGLNLSDVLAMQKWIDYAKGIEDSSVTLINQDHVCYQAIYDTAQARLSTFQFNAK